MLCPCAAGPALHRASRPSFSAANIRGFTEIAHVAYLLAAGQTRPPGNLGGKCGWNEVYFLSASGIRAIRPACCFKTHSRLRRSTLKYPPTAASELETKLARVRLLLERHALDALLVRRADNFAWLTCGAASHINLADSCGAAALLVTPARRHVLTNNIEAPRLQQEEGLAGQGWDFHVVPWHTEALALADFTRGLKLGVDHANGEAVDLTAELVPLRLALLPQESARFELLGKLVADTMDAAARSVRPGQTEFEIAASLASAALSRGVDPIVNLIATDERIHAYRHPLPSARVMQRYAMLVLCGRKWGLVCSITRLVHFGRLPDDLRRKAHALAQVDARFIVATRPGRTLGQIFKAGTDAYAAVGFADEWHLHHQGGSAGYAPREVVAAPDTPDQVAVGQAFAWNPSITGTKSEDTILVGPDQNTIITAISGWPAIKVSIDGQEMERPSILEVT